MDHFQYELTVVYHPAGHFVWGGEESYWWDFSCTFLWEWSFLISIFHWIAGCCTPKFLFKVLQVESYNTERALRKIKRHSSSPALDVSEPCAKWETRKKSVDQKGVDDLSGHHMERLKLTSEESGVCQINDMECESQLSEQVGTNKKDGHARSFIGWPSSWYKSFYNKTLKSCLKCLFFISSFA